MRRFVVHGALMAENIDGALLSLAAHFQELCNELELRPADELRGEVDDMHVELVEAPQPT